MELAEKEKQILFELVGLHDDTILFPRSVGCGHVVWWEKEPNIFAVECGMG
jgi:hypothetical protein